MQECRLITTLQLIGIEKYTLDNNYLKYINSARLSVRARCCRV